MFSSGERKAKSLLTFFSKSHRNYRYDLGSGASNLTTSEKVDLNQWNFVRITRNGQKGTLQLNEGPVVKGSSPGSQSELNLKMPLLIGGFRKVFPQVILYD